jgi:hypothetical protein
MPFDGNGNWTSNFSAEADRDAGYKILASRFDNIFIADIAAGFSNCVTRDGQGAMLTNTNANNYRVINVADPVNGQDAVNLRTLASIYPVGSIYIGTQETCPIASLIAGSTWELIAENNALWTSDGTNANTFIDQGLPQHTHPMFADVKVGSGDDLAQADKYVAKGTSSGNGNYEYTTKQTDVEATLGKTAGANYGDNTVEDLDIVQPPAYVVNVWRRTS